MKKLAALLFVLALCVMGLAAAEYDGMEFFAEGDIVPDFSVKLTDGSTFTLSEALETHDIVMVNLWATWCGPCRQEFPYMEQAYSLYSDRVALVCLSVEPSDTNEVISAYMQENGLTILPMGADTIGIGSIVVSEGIPTTIIIDKTGRYVYYECGSLQSVEQFAEIFDYFLSDEFDGEFTYFLPAQKPDVENPDPEVLTAAASDGSVQLTCDSSEYSWPFVPAGKGVANSNTAADTVAVMTADVSVSAGDVLSFDYDVNTEFMSSVLTVSVDDIDIAAVSEIASGTYAYRFEDAGDYSLRFAYAAYDDTERESAVVSNVRILSGAEADAAMAAMPVYARSLESGLYMTITDENVREIVFENDPEEFITEAFDNARFYIANGYTATVNTKIGLDIIPELAMVYGDYDYDFRLLKDCEYADGYIAEINLASVETGGYSSTYVFAFDNFVNPGFVCFAVVFANEENVNFFTNYELVNDNGEPMGITWRYADGEMPGTDEIAAGAEMVGGMYTYTVRVVDEEGTPVTGAMVNVCTDETCSPAMVDENGEYTFEGALYPYSVHVLIVPEGYSFDTETEYVMEGTELTIVMRKAA